MDKIKPYGKRILTLVAESENIQHREQFRDSRRGNRELNKRSKLFVAIQKYNYKQLKKISKRVKFSNVSNKAFDFNFINPLKINILHD